MWLSKISDKPKLPGVLVKMQRAGPAPRFLELFLVWILNICISIRFRDAGPADDPAATLGEIQAG